MIITREKLIRLAKDHVEQLARQEPSILSGYLIGTVTKGEPLLGGTADVDLVVIHTIQPTQPREVRPLSSDIHLDIYHHASSFYDQPTLLRVDPWWGPALSEPVFLHDPDHFFERVQAGVRGQFHRPDHALARAQASLNQARSAHQSLAHNGAWPSALLEAALLGANAVAGLTGSPAAGRRLSLLLEAKSGELGQSRVYRAFLRLLGAEAMGAWQTPELLTAWGQAFDAAGEASGALEFSAARRAYLLSGFQALAEADHPEAVLWPLLASWDQAVRILSNHGLPASQRSVWDDLLARLGLVPTRAGVRVDELESFLDHVESALDEWAQATGA